MKNDYSMYIEGPPKIQIWDGYQMIQVNGDFWFGFLLKQPKGTKLYGNFFLKKPRYMTWRKWRREFCRRKDDLHFPLFLPFEEFHGKTHSAQKPCAGVHTQVNHPHTPSYGHYVT